MKEDGVTCIEFEITQTGDYVRLEWNHQYEYEIRIYDLPWYERLHAYITSAFEETRMHTYCVENSENTSREVRVVYDKPDSSTGDIGYLRLEVVKYRTECKKEERIQNRIVLRGLTPEAEIPENVIQLFRTINVNVEWV